MSLTDRHVPEFHGFRAIAVTIVVLFHIWPANDPYRFVLGLWWVMIDGFFTLSGLLITTILLNTKGAPAYYRSFYLRRSARVMPAYYLLVIPLLAATVWSNWHDLGDSVPALWFLVYLGNFPVAWHGAYLYVARGILTPLWSLQMEEQFYAVAPIVVARLDTRRLTRLLCGALALSLCLRVALAWYWPWNDLVQWVLLLCHIDSLAGGALLAIWFHKRGLVSPVRHLGAVTAAAYVALLAFAAAAGINHITMWNRTLGFSLSAGGNALLIAWLALSSGSKGTAWLRHPVLHHIGKVSYAVYLLHVVVWEGLKSVDAWRPFILEHRASPFVVLAISVGLATLSWHVIEMPVRRRLPAWSTRGGDMTPGSHAHP